MLQSSKFDFLIKQHKNKIFNYSLYMVHNRMDAEDITQEVMIKIWKNINNFNFYAARGWIMRTTHNLCIDNLRQKGKQMKREISIDENLSERIEDHNNAGSPENVLNGSMIDERIKAAIRILPEIHKSSFVLYEVQGFKYKEISKILDIPLNSVKVNILRARKQLQKELKFYAKEQLI